MALNRNEKTTTATPLEITQNVSIPLLNRETSTAVYMASQLKRPGASTLHNFKGSRPLVVAVWICHFLVSILVMIWSSKHSDGIDHKYIPIDAATVDAQCSKAYADVLASEFGEESAIVCCTPDTSELICQTTPGYLIFAGRLAKLPEAWLLPLFPLMIRGVVDFFTCLQLRKSDGADLKRQNEINKFTIRRWCLYFGLIQVRGWILYLLFDGIENQIVASAADSCWYDGLLKSYQSPCQGSTIDFSDHIVLFFSQILPIPLTEVMFSFVAPFWDHHKTSKKIVPALLVGGLLYLYLLCFIGTYKTIAFFHTMFESIIGYLVSLVVQIPLFLLLGTSLMEHTRDYFFGRGI